jgi:predicted hydrocarbon binding protein
MEYEATQEEIKRLLEMKGDVRGIVFKTDYLFVLDKFGEEGVKKVEQEIEKMGYSFSYKKNINSMDFYPIGLRAISLLAISKVFNFGKKEIEEMGKAAPKSSIMVKFFMRYFLSIKNIFDKAGEMWSKHYTIGELESFDINMDKKYAVIRVHNVNLHHIFCDYLQGYFSSIIRMGIGEDITAERTKCIHRGDDYHEVILRW